MSRSPLRPAIAAALAAALTTPAVAQDQDSAPPDGAFIVTLGSDTLAVERYQRVSDSLIEGDLILRMPETRVVHYTVTKSPAGDVTGFSATVREPNETAGAPDQESRTTFGPDSATMELEEGDSTRTLQIATGPNALPMLNFSYGLYELATRRLQTSGQDSMLFAFVYPGEDEPTPTPVERIGSDSATIAFFGMPIVVRVDNAGRILGADASQTTMKVNVDRIASDSVDVAALARHFETRDAQGAALGQLSPRDTAQATVGQAELVVDYGRPAKRGRTVWGGVVPWGEIWRTGANAATQLMTDRNLMIAGTVLPAGSYTLWTLPTPDGTQLIINKETGQWGTDYDPAEDFVRIPLEQRTLEQPVERFTIAIEPLTESNRGVLRLMWDTTEYRVPFTVR